MRPVVRGALPTKATARGASPKRVIDYSYYRPDLIANLGEYCSYCEVPLGVNLAVEHMLSKKHAINADDWNNLLLACTNCNSHKLVKTQSEADLPRYFWPSERYPLNFNTFDMLVYRKEPKTVVQLGAEGIFQWPPRSGRPQNLYQPTTQTYDYVWVYPAATFAGDNAKTKKIKDTILLMGLNDFTPDDKDPKASDRRVFNRTTAWDRAETLATQLERYYNARVRDTATIDLLKEQIKQAAIATGFWSVWMTVFKNHAFVDNNTRNQLLRDLFVSSSVFPGTVYTVA